MALTVFHANAGKPQSGIVSLEEARCYIDELDLRYIAESMCAPAYPLPRWTLEDALQCCRLYKNFLYLLKKYLPIPLVPTREIDEFWHNHILYTRHYFRDCDHIFGHYLHHEPASPADDTSELINHFLETKRLYLQEFGEPLILTRT